jgi:ankyrin repeat protein
VKLLLEKGAGLEPKDEYLGQAPLSLAAANGREVVVKLLLEKGAEPEPKGDYYGRKPLSWAAANRHEAVVKLLLGKGARLLESQTSLECFFTAKWTQWVTLA